MSGTWFVLTIAALAAGGALAGWLQWIATRDEDAKRDDRDEALSAALRRDPETPRPSGTPDWQWPSDCPTSGFRPRDYNEEVGRWRDS